MCATLSEVLDLERFQTAEFSSRYFKVTDNGAIRYATYGIISVFCCNYVLMLHRSQDIITYLWKMRRVASPGARRLWEQFIMRWLQ